MQALNLTTDARRLVQQDVAQASGLIPLLRRDLDEIQELCETSAKVLGRGRSVVAGLMVEHEAITTAFVGLTGEFERVAAEARVRGYCTQSDLESVKVATATIASLALEASRLRMRVQGPTLRLVG